MSGSTIMLNREYFTAEITKAFLKDFELACETMDSVEFAKLFINYDLSFVEDYKDVLDTIFQRMGSWKDQDIETVLVDVTPFDSRCNFCYFGKTVKAYRWKYKQTFASKHSVVFGQTIAFYFDFNEDRLIEFGVCNSHLDKEEMGKLNTYE